MRLWQAILSRPPWGQNNALQQRQPCNFVDEKQRWRTGWVAWAGGLRTHPTRRFCLEHLEELERREML
ncbi:MAG: hypothetical protein NZ703_09355 [Gemmataceae bacterium]|nr:hypothetical protein [Gemmataceae bacterium]